MSFRRLARVSATTFAVLLLIPLSAGELGDTVLATKAAILKPAPSTTTTSPTVTTTTVPRPSATVETRMAKAIFEMVNDERAAAGLAPLEWSSDLTKPAVQWSKTMGNGNFLEHQDLNTVIDHRDPVLSGVGENILQASDTYQSAELHQLWMDSPGHRENIMKPEFDTIGIGVYCTPSGDVYATQEFGTTKGYDPPAAEPVARVEVDTSKVADARLACADR